MRAAWKVGSPTSARTLPAKSRCGADFMPWIGITSGIGEDAAPDDVEEIDKAGIPEHLADADAFFGTDPALFDLIRRIAHSEQEVVAHPFPAGGQHLHRESRPVFQTAAIRRGQGIGE